MSVYHYLNFGLKALQDQKVRRENVCVFRRSSKEQKKEICKESNDKQRYSLEIKEMSKAKKQNQQKNKNVAKQGKHYMKKKGKYTMSITRKKLAKIIGVTSLYESRLKDVKIEFDKIGVTIGESNYVGKYAQTLTLIRR